MVQSKMYSLSEAGRMLGENRNLIAYLVSDRGIPFRMVGKAKAIDAVGLATLREALADYRAKAEAVA